MSKAPDWLKRCSVLSKTAPGTRQKSISPGISEKPYLDALEARREAIARVTAEIENDDAVLMTGPTSIMHFCGLPTVTVAGGKKNADGVNEAVILYGKDECRLYEAALAIEQVLPIFRADCHMVHLKITDSTCRDMSVLRLTLMFAE